DNVDIAAQILHRKAFPQGLAAALKILINQFVGNQFAVFRQNLKLGDIGFITQGYRAIVKSGV
ncbi:MAG: hypothetical protein U0989_19450, partial [Azonexus sp.]|nr:hypothetical protein [Azonexus sp.]